MERQTIAAGGEVAVADKVFGGIGIGARRQKDGGDNREKRDCQGCTNPVSGNAARRMAASWGF